MGREKAKFYKANLRQQVISKLTSKLAVGESKHQDKINKVDTTKKIYSWGSFKTYQKQCLSFAKWLEQSHPEVKSINRAKPYIAEYLNHQLDKGCSAWTINTQAQSINKLYGIKKGDQYFFKCPERRRCDIVRSRYERANDSHYSLKNNSELTEFCRSTGLRRSEVKALQGNEALTRRQLELRSKSENSPKIAKMINDALLLPEKYQYFVYVKSGKGGRTRLAPIIGDKAKEIFAKAVEAGLMSKDYEWLGTASLYGYFVDRVSKELDITTGAGRIRWVLFKKTIVNHDTIVSTAKQAISDYKNKNLPPPNGDDIVDKIIKETR